MEPEPSLSEVQFDIENLFGAMEGSLAEIRAQQDRLARKIDNVGQLQYDLGGLIVIIIIAIWAGAEFHLWYLFAASAAVLGYRSLQWLERYFTNRGSSAPKGESETA